MKTATEIRNRDRRRREVTALALCGALLGFAATTPAAADEYRFELRARPHAPAALPPLPTPAEFPVQLVLDDDGAEGAFGVLGGQAARQFFWFNRFGPVPTFHLNEVWVLFPTDAPLGGAVQIVVFEDGDADPTTGATLRLAFDATVQVADGNTFSIYPLPAPVLAASGNDLLIGVVPRFIVSGQTPPLLPAALDSTASAGRSWFATWVADPPDPPSLPSDQVTALVDGFQPGNWMIRGFGTRPSAVEIPALADWGVGALVGLLALVGFVLLRRRRAAMLLLLPLVLLASSAGAQTTIDLFTTNQTTLSAPPDASSTATGGADILGTRRGLVVKNLLGVGPTSAGAAGGALSLAVTATTPDSRGEARLSWDGDTNPTVLDPDGLGGVNLVGSFARGFRIRVNSTSVAGVELELAVHTDGANASRAARLLPLIGSATDVLIPFSEFRVASGAGADFSDVGALELTVRGKELTVVIDEITTSLPAVAATKVDAQILDVDTDTRVDPGDRVRYTVTITNPGNDAVDVALADTVDSNATLVAGSTSSTPIARNDQYGWFGNVTLAADGSPFPTLLANDDDPDGDTVTVQSVDAASAQGGSVSLVSAATGEFLYVPPTGFKGVDSFGYTIVDDDAQTSTAIAYVSLEGVVWFVDNACAVGCGAGTQASPFTTLTAAEAPSGANDIIFVRTGVASYDTGAANGFTLDVDEQLLGEGVALVLGGTMIFPVGTPPTLTNNDGTPGRGLTLAGTGVGTDTVRGLTIGATGAAKIFGNAFGTFASDTVTLSGAGQALDLTNGALAVTFASLATTSSPGSGITLTQVSGSLTSTGGTTVTDPFATGIAIATSTAALGFGSTTVGKGTAGIGVFVTGSSGTTSFSQLAVTTSNGTALLATGSTLAIGGSASSVAATGGPALDLTAVTLSGGATFTSASSTGSTGKGINLDGNVGALVVNGGAISNPSGIAFDLNAGSANVTYAGSITNTANAFLIEITGRTGGTVTLSGNLSGTGSSNGINVANNSGGTVAFSGATKTLSTGGDAAVTLATNTGATINFTGGGLDIDTTSGAGFSATGGATAISVQGSGNSITSTTGTALNVASSTIGGSGLTFQSISANGATNGIVLNTTGASGGLTVTGAGTTDGSGGTIQNTSGRGASFISASSVSLSNMNFTSAGTVDLDADNSGLSIGDNLATNAAIHLQTVTGASLANLNITGGAEQGINGNAVSNFTLSDSSIVNAGNGPDEDGIHFFNMSGTSSITNTTINCTVATHNTTGGDDHLNLQMQSGTLNLTISGGSATNANKGSGYLMGIRGTSNATVTVDGVTADNNFSGGIVIDTFDTATSVIEIMNSTSTNNNDAISMSSNNGSTKFDIHDNVSFAGTDFGRINILKAAFSTTGTLEGRIRNNPIVVTDGQPADGIFVFQAGDGTLTVSITNNTFAYRGTQRPINIQGGQDGSGQLNATVTGNNIDMQLDGTGNAVTGIFAQTAVASPSGDNTNLCVDIGGAGGLRNIFTHSLGLDMAAGEIRVRQRFVTTVTLPGYGGANNDNAAVVAYLAGRNSLVNVPTATATNEVGVTPGAGGFVNAASCPQPNFP